MSGVSNSSHPETTGDSVLPESSRSTDVIDSSTDASQKQKKLNFNYVGIPIGDGSAKAPSKLGNLVRSHAPIRYKKWGDVPLDNKNKVWDKMKESFNFTDGQRIVQMRKAGGAWKKYKGKLRKLLKGDDMEKWIEAMPKKGVRPEDWQAFCVNEASPSQKALREKMKKIKNECPRKSTHNTGRLGYARAEEKFKEENDGRKPMRVELWLYAHKRKCGGYAPHDEELAIKFERLLEIMRQTGEVETLDSGPIFDEYGVDKRGSTRCVGSTISRTSLMSSSFVRQLLEEVDVERDGWKEEMKIIHVDNKKLMDQLNELAEGLKNGKYNHVPIGPTSSNTQQNHSYVNEGPQSHTFPESTSCKVLSHVFKLVAYGRKTHPGTTQILNGHVMQPNEAKVVIDEIIDSSYSVWGGEQDGIKTMGDVVIGSSLYWHDDLLPIVDDDVSS